MNLINFFKIVNRKSYFVILFSLFAFILCFSFLFFKYFSNVNIYQPISITVKGLNEKEINKITFYCTTPFNRKYEIYHHNNNWNNFNYSFNKEILLYVDDSIKKNISQIDIKIGEINYKFSSNDIIAFPKLKEDKSIYIFPENVTGDKSFLNKVFSIIYWKNTLKYISIFILILFALLIILFKPFLIKKLFRLALKTTIKIAENLHKLLFWIFKKIRIISIEILSLRHKIKKIHIAILVSLIILLTFRINIRNYIFNIIIIEIIDILIFLIIFFCIYYIYKKIIQIKKDKLKNNIKQSISTIITETFTKIFLIIILTEVCLRTVGIIYRFNQSEKINYTNQKKILKILCIGDSYTFGPNVPSGFDYPSQLEKLLNSKTNYKFKVYNRGVPGQNSSSTLNNLQMQFNSIKPDLVITLVGGRNVINQYGHGTYINQLLYQFKIYKMCQMIYNNITKDNVNPDSENNLWETNVKIAKTEGGDKKYYFVENKKSEEYKIAYNENIKNLEIKNKQEKDYLNIGTFYLREKSIYNAIKWYSDGIKIYPKYLQNYEGLAYAYLECAYHHEDSKKWILNELNKNENKSYLYSILGMICIKEKKYSEAINWLEKGIEYDNKNIECLFYLNDIRKNKTALISKAINNKIDSLIKKYPYNYSYYDSLNNKEKCYIFSNTYNYNIKKINNNNYSSIINWVYSDLRKIVEMSNSNKVKIIIQNYPLRYNDYYFTPIVNNILKNIALEYSLPFVDNATVFNALGNNKQYYLLSHHPNEKGYNLIAQNIFDKIIKEKIFNVDTLKK